MVRERAVRMVREPGAEHAGHRPGPTTDERHRVNELEPENIELRRALKMDCVLRSLEELLHFRYV